MTIEAMKQALEALIVNCGCNTDGIGKDAITALRTAIEQMEKQEPVAWHTVHKAVVTTIEKCKAASGMHRAIDLVVNAAQITHDTLGTDTTPPAAIKQDLTPAPAAPVQEPLFWYCPCSNGMYEGPIHNAQIEEVRKQSGAWVPLVTATNPPAAQPAPVKDLPFGVGGAIVAVKTLLSRDPCVHANTAIEMLDAILATPPAAQRQWVGLSEEEIDKLKHLIDWTATWSHGRFAYEIEQLLKEKNA